MYHTYAIKSINRNYVYVGITKELRDRINRHSKGQNHTTKPYTPFRLVYVKSFKTRMEARKHEKYLKSGCGKEYLKSLSSGGETCLPAGRLADTHY